MQARLSCAGVCMRYADRLKEGLSMKRMILFLAAASLALSAGVAGAAQGIQKNDQVAELMKLRERWMQAEERRTFLFCRT